MPVALVTGASRGLGLALATGLAEAGWRLVITAKHAEPLQLAAAELSELTTVTALPGDLTRPAHRAALVRAVEPAGAAGGGGLDLLINNAGILGPSPQPALGDYPLDVLRTVYEVNVIAQLGLAQLALPALRAAEGVLVNITSDAAVEAYEGWGGYGSAKAALEQAGRVLAAEEPRVRVWSVDPGDLRTRMHQEAFPGEDISDRPLPQTVVPAFLQLLDLRPASGRYRLPELVTVGAPGITGSP
ncbi:MAG: SDR family oxidoreductase [Sporichthyaceae bacterium]|nr:SDR family oxidoreductase [Sporichthyaceae bacterium]